MTHSDAKKSNSTHDFVAHIEHFTKKNLLLAGIFLALLLAMYAPGPGVSLDRLDLTGFLVGLIFFGQGMELDT